MERFKVRLPDGTEMVGTGAEVLAELHKQHYWKDEMSLDDYKQYLNTTYRNITGDNPPSNWETLHGMIKLEAFGDFKLLEVINDTEGSI